MSSFVAGFRERIEDRVLPTELDMICDVLEQYSHNWDINPIETQLATTVYTFPPELNLFLAVKRQDGKMSAKSREQYEMCLKDMHIFLGLPLRDITTMHLRLYLDHISTNRLTGKPIAKGTMNQRKCILRSYFGWLAEEEIIPKNIAKRIHVEKDDAKPREAYKDTDVERIRNSCNSLRDRAIIDLFVSSGVRVSELTSLNRKDIDLERREFRVFGKGGKWRVAYLDARTVVSLEDYFQSRKDDGDALFVSERKPYKRITNSAVRAILHELSDESNVDDIIPHRFRHTVATEAINHGMPLSSVQAMLGHSNVETTMRYAHLSNEAVKADYRRYVR